MTSSLIKQSRAKRVPRTIITRQMLYFCGVSTIHFYAEKGKVAIKVYSPVM